MRRVDRLTPSLSALGASMATQIGVASQRFAIRNFPPACLM